MFSANIEYYRPTDVQEVLAIFYALKGSNKWPLYYSGGTEIITFGRLNLIQAEAFIDIKALKESNVFEFHQEFLIIGAALPLTYIEEKNLFPLLSTTSLGIADHTARNKITLGGNLCGQIFYREAVLPFLLCDCLTVVAKESGIETVPIHQIFNQTFQLEEGQFLIQLIVEKKYIDSPFVSIKKRQQWETGYPVLTVAAIKYDNQLRFAFSGLCPFPFRSKAVEKELNNSSVALEERIDHALKYLPSPILDDIEGSKDYRIFVLKTTLKEIILELEGK